MAAIELMGAGVGRATCSVKGRAALGPQAGAQISRPEVFQELVGDGATIPRELFSSVYRDALCVLHATDPSRIAGPKP